MIVENGYNTSMSKINSKIQFPVPVKTEPEQDIESKQAGAELCQAQFKLRLAKLDLFSKKIFFRRLWSFSIYTEIVYHLKNMEVVFHFLNN